ncbi:hypothetical protein ADUPG1_012244 [Aduncisulcus paluster]|uniref:Uncharacterized protein n=1 Tax=Aduncisulcus paluster TaxID=2918883 RepID=A0ABQ5JYS9_9EUKA|nr:hypothetical protein ADUPG1_012244 [Aduncisulcus paluster]
MDIIDEQSEGLNILTREVEHLKQLIVSSRARLIRTVETSCTKAKNTCLSVKEIIYPTTQAISHPFPKSDSKAAESLLYQPIDMMSIASVPPRRGSISNILANSFIPDISRHTRPVEVEEALSRCHPLPAFSKVPELMRKDTEEAYCGAEHIILKWAANQRHKQLLAIQKIKERRLSTVGVDMPVESMHPKVGLPHDETSVPEIPRLDKTMEKTSSSPSFPSKPPPNITSRLLSFVDKHRRTHAGKSVTSVEAKDTTPAVVTSTTPAVFCAALGSDSGKEPKCPEETKKTPTSIHKNNPKKTTTPLLSPTNKSETKQHVRAHSHTLSPRSIVSARNPRFKHLRNHSKGAESDDSDVFSGVTASFPSELEALTMSEDESERMHETSKEEQNDDHELELLVLPSSLSGQSADKTLRNHQRKRSSRGLVHSSSPRSPLSVQTRIQLNDDTVVQSVKKEKEKEKEKDEKPGVTTKSGDSIHSGAKNNNNSTKTNVKPSDTSSTLRLSSRSISSVETESVDGEFESSSCDTRTAEIKEVYSEDDSGKRKVFSIKRPKRPISKPPPVPVSLASRTLQLLREAGEKSETESDWIITDSKSAR